MRNILRDLKTAFQEFVKPWPAPEDEDLVTPAAMRQLFHEREEGPENVPAD